jgi:hypothetical protein
MRGTFVMPGLPTIPRTMSRSGTKLGALAKARRRFSSLTAAEQRASLDRVVQAAPTLPEIKK